MIADEVKKELIEKKLVAIFRGVPLNKISETARALEKGGIRFLEICFNQESEQPLEEFAACYEAARRGVSEEVHIGAGTVLTEQQLELVYRLGGEMIVSPCTDISLIKKAKELGLICIPGAMTPSEINDAYTAGADLVKLYIVEEPKVVKMLRGPLGHIPMQITCNVSLNTIPKFLDAGIKSFGTRAILPEELIENEKYSEISELAADFNKAVLRAE